MATAATPTATPTATATAATAAPGWALPFRFARREFRAGLSGFKVFLACLTLGVAAIAAIGSLSSAINAGLRADAQKILGGDVEIRLTHREAKPVHMAHFRAAGTVSESVELRAMARPLTEANSPRRLLVELKAVDSAYPLYGSVTLSPAMPLATALAKDGEAFGAVAEEGVLTRLGLKAGDRVRVGEAVYVIRAAIKTEPDRGASAFTLGPRLMVAKESLAATALIQPGSLVRYYYKLRLPADTNPVAWAKALDVTFADAGWRVRDPSRASPRVRRFVDRLAMFLTLVGLTALLVGGVGVANATKGYLDGRTDTIAMLKCVGAPGSVIFRTYLIQILVLALCGIAIGVAIGAVVPNVILALFGDVLPVPSRTGIYPLPLLLAAGFGLLVALAFSVWPLAKAREIPGASLFRSLIAPTRKWPRAGYIALTAAAVVILAAAAIATAQDKIIAIWFVAAAAITLATFRGAAWLIARLAASVSGRASLLKGRPGLRLALANLHRPGAPLASVVLSLGLGLTVLVAVAQIEGNMSRQISEQIPEEAPTFYFIDIQPAQVEAFDGAVDAVPGAKFMERVPTLRGRIVKINGTPSAEARIAPNVQWTVRNERGLTYAAAPPPGSEVTEGKWWAADYKGPPIISLDEEVAAGYGIGIGDTLTINVLGRDVTATVHNLRRIDWTTLAMNFVVVFAPGALEGAPHTHVATARTTPEAESKLLLAITDRFPNVSAIRVKDALDTINTMLARIGAALRGTTAITLLAGILVLAGAVAAGHRRRVYDSVVLKVLGATRRDVLRAYLTEFGLLGLATALIAAALGTTASWLVLTKIMDFKWVFLPGETVATVIGATLVTMIFGFAGIWRALGQKAAPLLRNE